MLGRDRERAALDRLLDGARAFHTTGITPTLSDACRRAKVVLALGYQRRRAPIATKEWLR